jgi:hypothetical protein
VYLILLASLLSLESPRFGLPAIAGVLAVSSVRDVDGFPTLSGVSAVAAFPDIRVVLFCFYISLIH